MKRHDFWLVTSLDEFLATDDLLDVFANLATSAEAAAAAEAATRREVAEETAARLTAAAAKAARDVPRGATISRRVVLRAPRGAV